MNTTKLRVAIVGLGHGSSCVPQVTRHASAERTALVDVNTERLKSAADGLSGVCGYTDLVRHSLLGMSPHLEGTCK